MRSKNYTKNKEERLKKKKILKNFTKSLPDYVKDADKLFSKLVRLTYLKPAGMLLCYTCDTPLKYEEAQCGHFISRENYGLRWSLDNARVQCGICNSKHNDDPSIFTQRLESELPGVPEQLKRIAREVAKPGKSEILELIKEMKSRVEQLKDQ